jgi:hypothetical protein
MAGLLLLSACQPASSSSSENSWGFPPDTLISEWVSGQYGSVEEPGEWRYLQSMPYQPAYGYQGPFITERFDRAWFHMDQAHFIQLFQQPSSPAQSIKMYREINQLKHHQQQIISRTKEKHPHYRLYSPEETDEINGLFIAIRARQQWLRDSIISVVKDDWDAYYPAEYEYAFFEMNHLNIQGGIESLDVEIMDHFSAYNEEVIIAFLDTLPVPSNVYRGKEIFFINGYNADYGAVHANGQIMVFNLYEDTADVLKLISHEIGHEAGYLVFGRDGYENENEAAKQAYADLYGREVPVDDRLPWELRLSENFAEDFAWVYGGFPKWTYWQGVEAAVIRGFIETRLEQADLEESVLIRDNLDVTSGGSTMTYFGGIHHDHLFLTTNPEISIRIDGFFRGPYGLYAHVRNNVTGNLPRQAFHESGQVKLPLATLSEEQRRLSEEGFVLYEVQIKMYHYTSLQKYHQPTIARFHVLLWQTGEEISI